MPSHLNAYVSGEINQLDTVSEIEEICATQTATGLVCIRDNILLNIQNIMSEILESMDKFDNLLHTYTAETNVKLDKIIQSSGEVDVLPNNTHKNLLVEFVFPINSVEKFINLNEKLVADSSLSLNW